MNISDHIIGIIQLYEGYEPVACQLKGDRKGVITGGYGTITHPSGSPVKIGDLFSREYSLYCLQFEMKSKCQLLNNVILRYALTLNQNQFDALSSFAYNEGCGYFEEGHTLGDAMKVGNIQAIADALLLYTKGTKYFFGVAYKAILPGLVARRKSERELFLS